MKNWLVTFLKSDRRVTVLTRAATHHNAMNNACAAERVPESAVVSVCVRETPKQARRAVKSCQKHAKAEGRA